MLYRTKRKKNTKRREYEKKTHKTKKTKKQLKFPISRMEYLLKLIYVSAGGKT